MDLFSQLPVRLAARIRFVWLFGDDYRRSLQRCLGYRHRAVYGGLEHTVTEGEIRERLICLRDELGRVPTSWNIMIRSPEALIDSEIDYFLSIVTAPLATIPNLMGTHPIR